ncbi:MAG: phage tail sheath C-terminal domain-containing protein, partial [Methylococcales bacterium]
AWTGTAGTVLEKFAFASKALDAKTPNGTSNYYRDVINTNSKYIWWMDHPSQPYTSNVVGSGASWGSVVTTSAYGNLTSNVTVSLSLGVSAAPSDANFIAGYSIFSNSELYDVSLMPIADANSTITNSVISNVAEVRKDMVVFASPPKANVVNNSGSEASNIVSYRNGLTSSSYAVLDSGWKYQYDRYNDVYRWIPLNGDTAGLAVRTDFVADPWFSPAGFNRGQIKNVVKLAYSPSATDRDTLYKAGINPVVTFPGQGTVLYGDKTLLARPSAFDRINVRRLFIVLEKAIATASKYQLFEFNDPFTRAQFKNLVEPFLRDVKGRRGITDYKVVCDETNNTQQIIDTNGFVADIYIKPARSINFIQLNFIATRTGISFQEVGA